MIELGRMIEFTKMHGAGNDYVYVDCFAQEAPINPADLARKISDRRFGVGGDGLILILPSDAADARMRMFNADGSESEMCGNGIRCVAKYVYDHGIKQQPRLKIETGAGVLEIDLTIENGLAKFATVDMGRPILEPSLVPCTLIGDAGDSSKAIVEAPLEIGGVKLNITCVSMGNPHCVIFVPEATDDLVLRVGPMIENSSIFPKRTNVEFIEIISRNEVRQRTWERGSGETWACGTGASAVCVAGVLSGRTDAEIVNHLRGGDLKLKWDGIGHSVFMTGEAVEVFSGSFPA